MFTAFSTLAGISSVPTAFLTHRLLIILLISLLSTGVRYMDSLFLTMLLIYGSSIIILDAKVGPTLIKNLFKVFTMSQLSVTSSPVGVVMDLMLCLLFGSSVITRDGDGFIPVFPVVFSEC